MARSKDNKSFPKPTKSQKELKLKTIADTYYVWVGGSCDYGHEDRDSAGAYIIERNGQTIDTFVTSDDHTTEFHMMLVAMLHALTNIAPMANIVFVTNVAYISQNFGNTPSETSPNAHILLQCQEQALQHASVTVKKVPYHKYAQLSQTHDIAHQAMIRRRNERTTAKA